MNDNQRQGIWKLRRDGFGYGAIAQMLNLSLGSVKQYCRRHPELKGMGQFVKYHLGEGERPYCKNCMKKLHHAVQGRPKKFCSNSCRAMWWRENQNQHDKTKTSYDELTCQNCGRFFLSYASPTRKFCGHPCYVEHRFRKGVVHDNSTQHGN